VIDSWESDLFPSALSAQEEEKLRERCPSAERELCIFFGNFARFDNFFPLLVAAVYLALVDALQLWRKRHVPLCAMGYTPAWLRVVLRPASRYIRLLGYREEPGPNLASARLFVAPLVTGAGIKLKVKEYQLFSAPIIGTEIAFEGITPRPNDRLLPFWSVLREVVSAP
jgi:hypothetical protein